MLNAVLVALPLFAAPGVIFNLNLRDKRVVDKFPTALLAWLDCGREDEKISSELGYPERSWGQTVNG